jgi:hypothetical protein
MKEKNEILIFFEKKKKFYCHLWTINLKVKYQYIVIHTDTKKIMISSLIQIIKDNYMMDTYRVMWVYRVIIYLFNISTMPS